jgi:hypothetical protein
MTAPPLAFFLFDAEERIVNEVTRRLRESSLDHYRQMETIDLRPRIEAHFAAYREAVLSGDGTIFSSYVADIGRKRLQQGYGLEELLFVLDTLFDAAWEEAAEAWRGRGAEAFDDLRRLARGASWGKGRLATVYAEESKKERAALRRLSGAFDEYLRLRKASGSEGADEKKRGAP